ncbi:MAG TPA: GNAT family protein [Anaerolineales bacterium]|nr:GNAT family protein [Anaerolineales bacterium]
MPDNRSLELPTPIETERLLLRPYQPGDSAWYWEMSLRNRDHLLPFESDNPILALKGLEDAEILVREFAAAWETRKYFFLGAFEKPGLEFAAQIYIGVVNRDLPEFEVGYFADRDHEGRGYVSEAVRGALALVFDGLHARRVSLHCNPANGRSFRVAERCGFIREGLIRQNHLNSDGTVNDSLCYGLLREEWEAARKTAG